MFYLQMTPRGKGGGRRPPNRGGRGVRVDDISLPNTNIPPSFVLPTTMESTILFMKEPPHFLHFTDKILNIM